MGVAQKECMPLAKVGLTAGLVQDVFFSTQLADSAGGKWLGGPQVLLQGTLNGNVTDVIVTMNACACPAPHPLALSGVVVDTTSRTCVKPLPGRCSCQAAGVRTLLLPRSRMSCAEARATFTGCVPSVGVSRQAGA